MVELKHVSFRYGLGESNSEQASSLSDVSLTVRDGEFVLLQKSRIIYFNNTIAKNVIPAKTTLDKLYLDL